MIDQNRFHIPLSTFSSLCAKERTYEDHLEVYGLDAVLESTPKRNRTQECKAQAGIIKPARAQPSSKKRNVARALESAELSKQLANAKTLFKRLQQRKRRAGHRTVSDSVVQSLGGADHVGHRAATGKSKPCKYFHPACLHNVGAPPPPFLHNVTCPNTHV